MHKKVFLFVSIILFSLFCSSTNQYEQAIDYFYPLEKEKTYIYNFNFGTYIIKKIVRIEEIAKEKEKIVVRVSEEMNLPPGLRREFESAGTKDVPEKIKNEYEYTVQRNLIKRRQMFKGNKKFQESIYLKGPIKKGVSWKIQGMSFPQGHINIIKERKSRLESGNNLQTPNHPSKRKKIKHFKIKVKITNFKEEEIQGQNRKCIILTIPIIYQPNFKTEFKMIFCKGIGYCGLYADDEEWEKLVEIK